LIPINAPPAEDCTLEAMRTQFAAIWMFWRTPLFWLPGAAAISGPVVTVSAVLWRSAYLIGWSILFT
jgi:hypothetical protein